MYTRKKFMSLFFKFIFLIIKLIYTGRQYTKRVTVIILGWWGYEGILISVLYFSVFFLFLQLQYIYKHKHEIVNELINIGF